MWQSQAAFLSRRTPGQKHAYAPYYRTVPNVHLKSERSTDIPEQKRRSDTPVRRPPGEPRASSFDEAARAGVGDEDAHIERIFNEYGRVLIVAAGDFDADTGDMTLQVIRGDAGIRGNQDLAGRAMVPVERSIPDPAQYSLLYLGRGEMIDHLL